MKAVVLLLLLFLALSTHPVQPFGLHVFTVSAPNPPRFLVTDVPPPQVVLPAAVTTYDEALQILDQCALHETPDDQLYEAVRLLERQAPKFYPQVHDKEELWERAQGCWKLVLSTGNAKTRSFHPPPYLLPFSFAMIQGSYFGNGFGLNKDIIWLSVLQKHYYNPRIRHMAVTVQDIYVGGRKATLLVPKWIKEALHLGQSPSDFVNRPCPAFCLVAASRHALVARGNQSGALAIWKRLPSTVQPVAYKDLKSE